MGIYDRDYYRREGPSYLDSFNVRGQMIRWLLIINISLFVVQIITRHRVGQQWMPGPVTNALILDGPKVLEGQVWRLLTAAFIHDDGTGFQPNRNFFLHVVFNMWMLFMFGGYVEDLYGRWEFLAFYLGAALAGSVAYMLAGLTTLHPLGRALGASGAVTGVTILCAFHYPRITVLLFFVLPVPIWILAIFQVVQDSLGLLGVGRDNVGFSAHLGGAAFAALYYKMHWRLLSFWPSLRTWKARRSRPRLRVFQGDEETPQPVPVPSPPHAEVDEQLEAKVDAVLEKVARTGQGSLTDQERDILLKASEVYKRRRT